MITFKKGTYKVLVKKNKTGDNSPNNIQVKEVSGFLFTYDGIDLGMSKEGYDDNGILVKSDIYLITDISTGLGIRVYAKSKNEVESLLEKYQNIIDLLKTDNEKLNEARKIIRNSHLGGLLRR